MIFAILAMPAQGDPRVLPATTSVAASEKLRVSAAYAHLMQAHRDIEALPVGISPAREQLMSRLTEDIREAGRIRDAI